MDPLTRLLVSWIACMLLSSGIYAQTDSIVVLDEEALIQWVEAYHPVAKRGQLLNQAAEQEILYARGSFEPKAMGSYKQKRFEGTTYYQQLKAALKVESLWGPSLEGGYSRMNGEYLNPEHKLPDAGQAFLGVKLPVLRDLYYNGRRAALEQSRVMTELNANEQERMLVDLRYDARKAYWEWVGNYAHLELQRQVTGIAADQLDVVRQSFYNGFSAGIDTLEAFVLLQDVQLQLQQANWDYQKASLTLSIFLWDDEGNPRNISDAVRPPLLADLGIPELPNGMNAINHPLVQAYDFELNQMDIEMRWRRNQLLPKLDLEYNFLARSGVTFFNGAGADVPLENYKVGVKFSSPIFMRKERAKVGLTELKIVDLRYKRQLKTQEIDVKQQQASRELAFLETQLEQYEAMVANYRKLLDAELEKFAIGESSLFKLNARTQKWLESQQKQLKTRKKWFKTYAQWLWSNGQ